MLYFSTCSQRCGSSLKRKDSSTTPEEAERGPEGRQRCSLTLFMLITSIYCAHNMGAAPSSELPVPCSISTSKSCSFSWPCYCSFYILHALLSSFSCSSGLRATHASLDTLPAALVFPILATHFFLWTFFFGPIPILRQRKFNYRMRIFLRSPLLFLFVSFPLRMVFCFRQKHPKTNFQRISIYLLLIYAANKPPAHRTPSVARQDPLHILQGYTLSQTIDIHIHNPSSVVEYLPSMLIEFFPVD